MDGGYGTNSTTPLVKKIAQNGISFEYEYDSRGNITSEKRGDLTTTYQYDALGQLIRVNDPHENATWVYNYDRGGNILSKVKYAYTTGAVGTAIETIPYVYGDSNWKDKLTSYNGQTITYDAIGNPLNDGTWSYTWEAGRQLKQMSAEGTSVSFKYDHNGMRVQKVVEQSWYPETTNYTYHGKLLTHMTVDYTDFDEVAHQDEMHFFYDAQSRPAKVEFNGTAYTYLHNLQGDVVGLLDSSGTLMVEYKYDAWGKPLSTTGTLGDTLGKCNPFRYRGYVFDEETGLYYLRSRYYNPAWKRFVNADVVEHIPESILFNNLFTYCSNAPTLQVDSDGEIGSLAIGLLGAVSAFANAAVSAVSAAIATVASIVTAPVVTVALGVVVGVAAVATVVNVVTTIHRYSSRPKTAEQTAEKSLTKTYEKINRESNRYDYWIARFVRLGNGVETFIPATGISWTTAISVLRSGGNVFASSRRKALQLALAAGTGKPPIKDPRHYNRKTGSSLGYLRHYHEGYRGGGHVFYL